MQKVPLFSILITWYWSCSFQPSSCQGRWWQRQVSQVLGLVSPHTGHQYCSDRVPSDNPRCVSDHSPSGRVGGLVGAVRPMDSRMHCTGDRQVGLLLLLQFWRRRHIWSLWDEIKLVHVPIQSLSAVVVFHSVNSLYFSLSRVHNTR